MGGHGKWAMTPSKGETMRNHGSRWHGMRGTPTYRTWQSMIQRCTDPNSKSFSRYGGRGITICLEWRHSFMRFLCDMGSRPSTRYSIDRIDNSKGYFPENC